MTGQGAPRPCPSTTEGIEIRGLDHDMPSRLPHPWGCSPSCLPHAPGAQPYGGTKRPGMSAALGGLTLAPERVETMPCVAFLTSLTVDPAGYGRTGGTTSGSKAALIIRFRPSVHRESSVGIRSITVPDDSIRSPRKAASWSRQGQEQYLSRCAFLRASSAPVA